LAAIDTALWDLRCRRAGEPLWKMAGGAQTRVPVYTTEGGWLHHSQQQLVDEAVAAKAAGFKGCKVKVGKPSIAEDVTRLSAVREAVGDAFEVMVDANQAFTVAEARRRAHAYEPFGLAWFEEPLPAEDLGGHVELAAAASMPIAVGESLYHPAHFREYLQRGACSVVQVDCARIGGITPWLKVAHTAEAFNAPVCPHFLMELHVSLSAAVPNGTWVEYIPQLDAVTTSRMTLRDGFAVPPDAPGLGIEWDFAAIDRLAVARATVQ
jgi:L-alanine-DL-glutamate epimerase-like enolase superfamily enzyme